MADDLTTVAPTQRYFPYEGIPIDPAIPVPLGEVQCVNSNFTIPAPGAGNNQALDINCPLDKGWAYVLLECFASIAVGGTNTWEVGLNTIWRDGETTNTMWIAVPMISEGIIEESGAEVITYYPPVIPDTVMRPNTPDDGAFFKAKAYNATINGGAATGRFYARFLRFGIQQAQHYGINFPIPVR